MINNFEQRLKNKQFAYYKLDDYLEDVDSPELLSFIFIREFIKARKEYDLYGFIVDKAPLFIVHDRVNKTILKKILLLVKDNGDILTPSIKESLIYLLKSKLDQV